MIQVSKQDSFTGSDIQISPFGDFILNSRHRAKSFLIEEMVSRDPLRIHLKYPSSVVWLISRRCNLNCRHCYNACSPSIKESHHTDPYVIADQIIECQPFSMCLCGGEPLIWEPFFDIVRHLYSGGLRSIGTVSNGYLATKEIIARMRKAGLDNLQFSVDGYRPETHDWLRKKPDSHRRVLKAIDYAVKEGYSVAVAFCPTRFNVNEINDVIDLLVEKGIKQFRCQPFMPLGNGLLNAEQLMPTEEQYFFLKWAIKTKDKEYGKHGIRFEWGDPLEHIAIFSHKKSLMHILSVCEDGMIELSPYMPLRIGDIKKHTLLESFNMGLMEKAWQHPVAKEYAKTLSVIRGMTILEPRPYFDPPVFLDILN